MSGRHTVLVQVFGGNIRSVIPENRIIQAETDELLLVLQFLESRVLQQGGQVNLLPCSVAEGAKQGVIS